MAPRRVLLALTVVVLLLAQTLTAVPVSAQASDEVMLRIERQLLCPQCTNKRLDVCETQLCFDMRTEIRERLARGESDQQIIDYFVGRYGQRVLAAVPREGFNLVLFGWVTGSIVLLALFGLYMLPRMRRTATPQPDAASLDASDERWLDEQLGRADGRDAR